MPFIIIFAILAIIAALLRTPKVRGMIGEFIVKKVAGKTKEGEQYVINDLILEHDGKSSQIDHIVINPRGVFVIETKNYSGRIYGSETQHEWTQVLAYGKVKNKLYNPLKQNATHIYNVKRVIGDLPINSLVVFVQNNTKYITTPHVIPVRQLKKHLQTGENTLSVEKMKEVYDLLLINKSSISTNEHVKNIHIQQQEIRDGICPRCGGKLVLRKGKYGEFLGCSNYPKCKFKMTNRNDK